MVWTGSLSEIGEREKGRERRRANVEALSEALYTNWPLLHKSKEMRLILTISQTHYTIQCRRQTGTAGLMNSGD